MPFDEALLGTGHALQGREAIEPSPTSATGHSSLGKAPDAVGENKAALDACMRKVQLEPGAGAV